MWKGTVKGFCHLESLMMMDVVKCNGAGRGIRLENDPSTTDLMCLSVRINREMMRTISLICCV